MNYAEAQATLERLRAVRSEFGPDEQRLLDVVDWLFENCGPIYLGHLAARAFSAAKEEPVKPKRRAS